MSEENTFDPITADVADAREQLQALFAAMQHRIDLQAAGLVESADIDAQEDWMQADPDKWLRKARDHMQMGMMFLERAIAQPTHF